MLNYISLKNYRNINSLKTDLSSGINIIVAKNGSGKTNFLESIYLSTLGQSFKPVETSLDFIGQSEDFARVETKWDLDTIELIVKNNKPSIEKLYLLNKKRTTISKITSKFPVILFAPNSVDLVTGEPKTRRDDINSFLSILHKDYKKTLNSYNTVLKNRNAVIKQIREQRVDPKTLNFWTDKLIELNYLIFSQRVEFFENIKEFFSEAQSIFFDDKDATISSNYLPNIAGSISNFKDLLSFKFNQNQQKEIIVGKTLYGVHKDDFSILQNELNLKFLGSRGQQRIGISIFKFAQLLYYFQVHKIYPLLLLDDIMSELDDANRNKISDYLVKKELQFILTSAEINEIPKYLINNAKVIEI